jgi:hypothetical protein
MLVYYTDVGHHRINNTDRILYNELIISIVDKMQSI